MKARCLVPLVALLAACESERTIPTHAHPSGEVIPCVGITSKYARAGIDYDLSIRNAFWGIVGVESVLPPLLVLHHETFCPVSDTSTVKVTK